MSRITSVRTEGDFYKESIVDDSTTLSMLIELVIVTTDRDLDKIKKLADDLRELIDGMEGFEFQHLYDVRDFSNDRLDIDD